jgi:hypothetical protein
VGGAHPTSVSFHSPVDLWMRVLKVIDAPWFKIIDGTGAFSTASAKLLKNRRFRSNYLGHAHLSSSWVYSFIASTIRMSEMITSPRESNSSAFVGSHSIREVVRRTPNTLTQSPSLTPSNFSLGHVNFLAPKS